MDDLISRQAAIDGVTGAKITNFDDTLVECPEECNAMIDEAVSVLEQLPSLQPEIVRCGQCKYAEVADKEDAQDGYTCQFHRGSVWFSGSYCSWAERRTDERSD